MIGVLMKTENADIREKAVEAEVDMMHLWSLVRLMTARAYRKLEEQARVLPEPPEAAGFLFFLLNLLG